MGVFSAHLQINRSKCMLSVYWAIKKIFRYRSHSTVCSISMQCDQIKIFTSIHFMPIECNVSVNWNLNNGRIEREHEKNSARVCVCVCSEITVMVISARRTSLSMGLCVHSFQMIINCIRPFNQAISISSIGALSNPSEYKQLYARAHIGPDGGDGEKVPSTANIPCI